MTAAAAVADAYRCAAPGRAFVPRLWPLRLETWVLDISVAWTTPAPTCDPAQQRSSLACQITVGTPRRPGGDACMLGCRPAPAGIVHDIRFACWAPIEDGRPARQPPSRYGLVHSLHMKSELVCLGSRFGLSQNALPRHAPLSHSGRVEPGPLATPPLERSTYAASAPHAGPFVVPSQATLAPTSLAPWPRLSHLDLQTQPPSRCSLTPSAPSGHRLGFADRARFRLRAFLASQAAAAQEHRRC